MRRNSPPVYSECCNVSPIYKEPTICSKCLKAASFYDVEDTMSVEEFFESKIQNNDSKFDIDLKYGQIREQLFQDIMLGKEKVEVKTERDIWKTTGNIAIEWQSRGKLSGIATTEADWWAHFLADGEETKAIILMPVKELKAKIKKMKKLGIAKETNGGDDNTSKLILLPLNQLLGEI